MERKSYKHTKDMSNGSIYKNMLFFSLPLFISQLFQQLYNTADIYIVGKVLGHNALAAVSSSGTLIFLLISFFIGVSQGAGVAISRYFGAKDQENVSKAIHTNVAFGLVSSVFLTIIGVYLTPTFLKWMNTDEKILPEAIEYFKYYFLGISTNIFYNIFRGILNALGDSKRPLVFLISSSILNICLDYVFLKIFGWGVWSAAIATVISQFVSVILCLFVLCKKNQIYTISLKKIRFYKGMTLDIIRYGLPSGVQNSVIGFANVIVQSQINSFGDMATAAYGSYSKIEGFAFLPINSFNMAITTFVSQNLGAGLKDRAKKGAIFGILFSLILSEIIGIIFYILAPNLIAIFDDTKEVVEYGTMHARICSLFYFLLAFSHAIASVCRGAGKAFVPMIIMLSVWCLFRICYILTVMKLFNRIDLIYWAYPITWSISSIIYLLYFLFSNWINGFDNKESK